MTAREQFPSLAALLVNGKAPQRILDEIQRSLDLIDTLEAENIELRYGLNGTLKVLHTLTEQYDCKCAELRDLNEAYAISRMRLGY